MTDPIVEEIEQEQQSLTDEEKIVILGVALGLICGFITGHLMVG